MAKTNWQMGETVMPSDLNELGREVNENIQQLNEATNLAEADTLVKRDFEGRFKSSAPIAFDDVARRVDVVVPPFVTTTGTGTSYIASFDPAYTVLLTGTRITIKVHAANTSNATVNVNGLGAKTIKKPNGSNLFAGNLKANSVYTLVFDGTDFILQGEGGSGTAQPSHVLSGKTFTNDDGEQVGTMVDRAGDTEALSSAVSGTTLRLRASEGYRDGVNDFVTLTDSNFIASNIKSGVTIHGLTGTYNKVYGSNDVLISGSMYPAKNQISVLRNVGDVYDIRAKSQPLFIDTNGDYYESVPNISNSLARYDIDDNLIWAREFGQPFRLSYGHDNTLIVHLTNDNTLLKLTKNNVVVYTKSIGFAPGWTSFTEDKDGNYIVTVPSEGYIRKYSPSFNAIWYKSFSFAYGRGTIFDSDANGNFIISMTGGGETPYTSNPVHWYGFNSSGTQLWSKTEVPHFSIGLYYAHATLNWIERTAGKWWRVHSYYKNGNSNSNALNAYSTTTGSIVETINIYPDYNRVSIVNGHWIFSDGIKYQVIQESNRSVSPYNSRPNSNMSSINRASYDSIGDAILWGSYNNATSRVKVARATHYKIL